MLRRDTTWDSFFHEKMIDIFEKGGMVLDIGEGLRVRKERGNRYDPTRAWLAPYVEKVTYTVMDPVPDFKPDIVGDIHKIPLPSDSVESIICLAVLEHVENPLKAMEEMYRVLKPGGQLFLYVPFLYYYHAERGYYKDYWRFTYDTLEAWAAPFTSNEISHVRSRIETLCRLTPLGRFYVFILLARFIDHLLPKRESRQVSGYYQYLIK